jgi:hypothetical protein
VISRPSSTTSPTTTTLNPIALKISTHPQLALKVTSLLPSGMTLNRASTGFKNQGQFTKATTAVHQAETEADNDVKRTSTTSSTSKTTKKLASHTSTTTSTLTKLNPIARKISSHPQLAAQVAALLPAGLTLNQASKGFKNQGQFLAALHASKDLNIPFAQLKAEMTGKDHDSLGVAIHELKPGINAKTAAKTADQEADADVKATTPQRASHTGDQVGDDH